LTGQGKTPVRWTFNASCSFCGPMTSQKVSVQSMGETFTWT